MNRLPESRSGMLRLHIRGLRAVGFGYRSRLGGAFGTAMIRTTILLAVIAAAAVSAAAVSRPPRAENNMTATSGADTEMLYIGSYTENGSPGITALNLNLATGALAPADATAPASQSPSFLAFSPNHKFLYAVNEVDDFPGPNGKGGAVTAFSIDPN